MQELVLDPYLRQAGFDLLMDGALLWTVAAVAQRRTPWHRLLAGAFLGSAYGLWQLLAMDGYLPGWYGSLPLPLAFAAHFLLMPSLMLMAVFLPCQIRQFWRLTWVFFTITALTYGLANVIVHFLQQRGYEPSSSFYLCLEIGLVLAVAEIGWGALHRMAAAGICQLSLFFVVDGLQLETQGYLDTGNRLLDPVTRKPVIVVDYRLLRELMTPSARAFVEAMAENGIPPEMPLDDPWLPRLRVIPYRAVAKKGGLLPALRVDQIRLGQGERTVTYENIVLGLEMAGGLAVEDCRALVPPALWSWA